MYFPGIVKLWSSGRVCPLQARGHIILEQCGSEVFSLDDFFASLQAATNVFWSALAMLSAAAGRVDQSDDSEFVQKALDRMARYGAGSIDLWTAAFKVLDVMVAEAGPPEHVGRDLVASLHPVPGVLRLDQERDEERGGQRGRHRTEHVPITQNVLLNVPVGPCRAWRTVVNTLDEMREQYESDVVDYIRQSCAGVSLMMGLTNPWAVYVYQQCLAANTAVEAGLDVALGIFNLAPFAQSLCMCTSTAGKAFADHAMAYCFPQASTSLRPVLLQMIQATSATLVGNALPQSQALCQDMINYTKPSWWRRFSPGSTPNSRA